MTLLTRTADMASAASRWMLPSAALELARNVAMTAGLDEEDGIECDVVALAQEAIEHRRTHFGLECSDVDACAYAMAQTWIDSRPEPYCSTCAGTGIGMGDPDTSRCYRCGGSGVTRLAEEYDGPEYDDRTYQERYGDCA